MASKTLKMHSGRVIVFKSILLESGNLLIPARMGHDSTLAAWAEVVPDSKDYRRWIGVAESEADPRTTDEYKAWWADVEKTEAYQTWVGNNQ